MTNDQRTPRYARRRVAPAVVVLILLAAFAAVLTLVLTRWSPLRSLDLGLDRRLNDFFSHHHNFTSAAKAVTDAGQPLTFEVLAVLGAVVLWISGHPRLAIFTPVTVLGAGLLGTIVKALVDRARPTLPVELSRASGASFPSGHALSSTAGLGALVFVLYVLRVAHRRTVAGAAVAVGALIGFSRLALGVHYLSDVVAGWLLGVAWVLILADIYAVIAEREPAAARRWRRREPPARGQPPERPAC